MRCVPSTEKIYYRDLGPGDAFRYTHDPEGDSYIKTGDAAVCLLDGSMIYPSPCCHVLRFPDAELHMGRAVGWAS